MSTSPTGLAENSSEPHAREAPEKVALADITLIVTPINVVSSEGTRPSPLPSAAVNAVAKQVAFDAKPKQVADEGPVSILRLSPWWRHSASPLKVRRPARPRPAFRPLQRLRQSSVRWLIHSRCAAVKLQERFAHPQMAFHESTRWETSCHLTRAEERAGWPGVSTVDGKEPVVAQVQRAQGEAPRTLPGRIIGTAVLIIAVGVSGACTQPASPQHTAYGAQTPSAITTTTPSTHDPQSSDIMACSR